MKSATTANSVCNVIRYKRPPGKRPGNKSGFALRLEGSLAAVVTLAPVIPIFPMLAFPGRCARAEIEKRNSKT